MYTFTANNLQSGMYGLNEREYFDLVSQFRRGMCVFALTVETTHTFTHGFYDFGSVYFYDDFFDGYYGDDE